MARHRFGLQFGMALFVALGLATASRAQTAVPPTYSTGPTSTTYWATPSTAPVCKVYSLSDVGDDQKLCQWIADTIPQMIQPDAWKCADGKAKLSYFAPGKVLVINQSPAIHAQVDEFLQSMKKSVSQTKVAKRDPQVVQAQFAPAAGPMPPPYSIVGSQTPPAPKHLLHFILGVGLRYEGEGIIDSNVVKFAKAMSGPGTCLPNAVPLTQNSSDSMIDSDNLRQIHDEWRKFWSGDQPSNLTPNTISGGVGSAATSNAPVTSSSPIKPAGASTPGTLTPASGMTLPQSMYLRHPPQYVPPMPPADAPAPSAPRSATPAVVPVPPAPPTSSVPSPKP